MKNNFKIEFQLYIKKMPEIKLHFNNFGMHVSKGDDMARSILTNLYKYQFKVTQIFTHGPRTKHRTKMNYEEVKEAKGMGRIYVHSSYLTNPWGDIKKNKDLDHTIDQFKVAHMIGARGVVLHIPKIDAKEVASGMKVLADELKAAGVVLNAHFRIILEMKALKAHDTKSFENPTKINNLIDELKDMGLTFNEIGICVDTAHIYASKAQIKTYYDAKKYIEDLNNEWIYLIHLNGNEYDSKKRAGDKHAIPLSKEDKLWGRTNKKNSGCRAFLEYAQQLGIDVILEAKSHHTHKQVNAFLAKYR